MLLREKAIPSRITSEIGVKNTEEALSSAVNRADSILGGTEIKPSDKYAKKKPTGVSAFHPTQSTSSPIFSVTSPLVSKKVQNVAGQPTKMESSLVKRKASLLAGGGGFDLIEGDGTDDSDSISSSSSSSSSYSSSSSLTSDESLVAACWTRGTSHYGDDGKTNEEELTYTEALARAADDALTYFHVSTTRELISLIAERKVAIAAEHALAREETTAKNNGVRNSTHTHSNLKGGAHDLAELLFSNNKPRQQQGRGSADVSTDEQHSKEGSDRQHIPFSISTVRQLASWKVAMQKDKDLKLRKVTGAWGAVGDAADEGDTFFTTMPLQYNDFADAHVTSKVYATPQQHWEDKLIYFMKTYYVWITLIFTVMHIIYFSMVTFRCGFGVPYEEVDYAIEWIVLEIPMGIFAFITDILPREYKGVYKVQLKVEAIKYLKSFSFISDVLGFIPLDVIGFAIGSRCSLTNSEVCGFLSPYWKLNRILLARYAAFNTGDLMETVTLSTGYPPQVARLTLSLIYLLLTAHTAACIFNIYLETNPILCKIWLDDSIYLQRTLSDKYFQSLDWSTKSLLSLWRGFNFNLPIEVIIFVLILALAGTVILSSFVGMITALLFRRNPYEVATAEINLLYDEFSHKGLPDDLRAKAREYYWHLHSTVGRKDVIMDALDGLPKSLQARLTLQVGRDMLSKVPLLAPEAHNNEFVLALTVALVPQVVHPLTVLFKKGDRGDSMSFVTDGAVAVVPTTFITTLDVTNIYFLLKTGSFFGEIALILGVPRTATIATLNRFANLLVLNEDNFRQIASDFPSAIRRMRLEAESRLAALNQGPEALNRERAKRLLDAINMNRTRHAYGKWIRGFRQRKIEAALGVVMESGAVTAALSVGMAGVSPQQRHFSPYAGTASWHAGLDDDVIRGVVAGWDRSIARKSVSVVRSD